MDRHRHPHFVSFDGICHHCQTNNTQCNANAKVALSHVPPCGNVFAGDEVVVYRGAVVLDAEVPQAEGGRPVDVGVNKGPEGSHRRH